MTNQQTNNEWIERFYDLVLLTTPSLGFTKKGFVEQCLRFIPQSISREAISKKETTDEKIEKIKEMLGWYKGFMKDSREIYPEGVVSDLENILSSK